MAPQWRRVNVVGASISYGPAAGTWRTETAVQFPLPKHRTTTAMQACVSAGLAAGAAAAWAGVEAAVATAEEALEAVQHAARRVELAQAAPRHGVAWWDFRACTAAVLPAFLSRLAGRPLGAPEDWRRERPLWVVLDNYSVPRCRAVQAARHVLEAANIQFDYLPPYSPELQRSEGMRRTVKYTDLTRRSYDHLGEYRAAVQDALQRRAAIIREKHAAKPPRTCTLTPSRRDARQSDRW